MLSASRAGSNTRPQGQYRPVPQVTHDPLTRARVHAPANRGYSPAGARIEPLDEDEDGSQNSQNLPPRHPFAVSTYPTSTRTASQETASRASASQDPFFSRHTHSQQAGQERKNRSAKPAPVVTYENDQELENRERAISRASKADERVDPGLQHYSRPLFRPAQQPDHTSATFKIPGTHSVPSGRQQDRANAQPSEPLPRDERPQKTFKTPDIRTSQMTPMKLVDQGPQIIPEKQPRTVTNDRKVEKEVDELASITFDDSFDDLGASLSLTYSNSSRKTRAPIIKTLFHSPLGFSSPTVLLKQIDVPGIWEERLRLSKASQIDCTWEMVSELGTKQRQRISAVSQHFKVFESDLANLRQVKDGELAGTIAKTKRYGESGSFLSQGCELLESATHDMPNKRRRIGYTPV